MLSVAVFYPKSQLGLISLHLFWVIKNCLCTCFLFPDSAFSSQGRGSCGGRAAAHCANPPLGSFFPKAGSAPGTHSTFQGTAHSSLGPPFVCDAPRKMSFHCGPVQPSDDSCNSEALQWVIGRQPALNRSTCVSDPPQYYFFVCVLFFILMGKI